MRKGFTTLEKKNRFILVDCINNRRIYIEGRNNEDFLSTNKGNISFEDIRKAEWGSVVKTHLGHAYRIIEVDLHDFTMFGLKRETQIIYPKDSSYICSYLSLKNGDKVFECGCGSGALTMAMANIVAPKGKIFCYERKKRFIELAEKNLQFSNLIDFVTIKEKNLEEEDIDENDFDAAFVDVKEPWLILRKVSEAMKNGKKMGILVPTVNQIIEVLNELKKIKHFDIQVKEIFTREFKTIPDRVRPDDRMVAHTGFLIFSRKGV
jgi:tRNA (adenine57-N1/adenine58-N1)-methyltransferase